MKTQSIASISVGLIFSIASIFSGCKTNALHTSKNYPNEIQSLKLAQKDLDLVSSNEPNLLDEIVAFRKSNNNEEKEITTVRDFVGLQKCEKPQDCTYQDFPNEFQGIFDFYSTIKADEFVWIQKKENVPLKNHILKFLIKHWHEDGATDYVTDHLQKLMVDPEYVSFIYRSSIN